MGSQTDHQHQDTNGSSQPDDSTQRTEAAQRWDHSVVHGATADASKRAEWDRNGATGAKEGRSHVTPT